MVFRGQAGSNEDTFFVGQKVTIRPIISSRIPQKTISHVLSRIRSPPGRVGGHDSAAIDEKQRGQVWRNVEAAMLIVLPHMTPPSCNRCNACNGNTHAHTITRTHYTHTTWNQNADVPSRENNVQFAPEIPRLYSPILDMPSMVDALLKPLPYSKV